MKRRYGKSTLLLILTIASFLLFNSCGIPTYLYLENNDVAFSTVVTNPNADYDITLRISKKGFEELKDKNTTPSVKLFYAYSTNPLKSAEQVTGSKIRAENVESHFTTLYRSKNGGAVFSPGSTSAPALYLYNKTGSSSLSSQIKIFDYDATENIDVMLLGTFSTRSSSTNDDEGFYFNGGPEMDFTLPLNSTIFTTTPNEEEEASFSLEVNPNGDYTEIKLSTPSAEEFYLGDYRQNRFFGNTSTKEKFIDRLKITESDEQTFEAIINGLNNSLYIHIWVSLFGGEGDFNNIVWSELQYIDAIQLK